MMSNFKALRIFLTETWLTVYRPLRVRCPGQFKLAEWIWGFPVFSLWFFWVSWVHFFCHSEYFTDGYALFQIYFWKRTMHHFKGFDIFQIWAPKLRTYIFIIAVPLGRCLCGFDVGHSCSKMPGPFQAYWLYLGLPRSSFWFFWVSLGRCFFENYLPIAMS